MTVLGGLEGIGIGVIAAVAIVLVVRWWDRR